MDLYYRPRIYSEGRYTTEHAEVSGEAVCRYYVKLTGFASGEKNRAQNCLTMCNFKLDDVVSDVFGKRATRVLDALLEHGNEDFELDGLISGKCKTSPELIYHQYDFKISLSGDATTNENVYETCIIIMEFE